MQNWPLATSNFTTLKTLHHKSIFCNSSLLKNRQSNSPAVLIYDIINLSIIVQPKYDFLRLIRQDIFLHPLPPYNHFLQL